MKKIAVIDIGSNTIRLIVLSITEYNSFRIIDDHKITARLGEGLQENNCLQEKNIKIAINSLKIFKNLCETVGVSEIICVATAAVRKAQNGQDFINRIIKECAIAVRILSGHEEALMDYFGVINSFSLPDGLLMDIGGGSIELALFKERQLVNATSIPYGTLDLAKQFNLSDKIYKKDLKKLNSFIHKLFQNVPWLSHATNFPLIGVGGSLRNFGKISRVMEQYPLDNAHNYIIATDKMQEITSQLSGCNLKKRKKIKGLSKDRADIIVGAAVAVSILAEYIKTPYITISGAGLREGLVYKYLLPEEVDVIPDVLEFSLLNTMHNFNANKKHCFHVYNLCKDLFSQLQPVHLIKTDVEKILKTAAYLHDCGMHIRYYDHQDHSFYMILNGGINGLTHRELLSSALIAGNHRNKKCNTCDARYLTLLTEEDQKIITKLSVIIKIAESLDRSQINSVLKLNCEITSNTVTIHTKAKDDISIEHNACRNYIDLFREVFGRNLVVS